MNLSFPEITQLNQSYDKLYTICVDLIDELVQFLNDRGIDTLGDVTVEKSQSFLCFYCLEKKKIFLSLPDESSPFYKIQLEMFKSILGLKENKQLFQFIYHFIPWVIFHEIGHLLRDRYNQFGEDLWHEEQIANLFAACLFRKVFKPQDIDQLLDILTFSFEHLQKELKADEIYKTHRDPLAEIYATGSIDPRKIQGISTLAEQGKLKETTTQAGEKREELIEKFNEAYTSDLTKYFFYQIGWVILDLKSPRRIYEQEFSDSYLSPIYFNLKLYRGDKVDAYQDYLHSCSQKLETINPQGSLFFKDLFFESVVNDFSNQQKSDQQVYLSILREIVREGSEKSPYLSLLPDNIKKSIEKLNTKKNSRFDKKLYPLENEIFNYYQATGQESSHQNILKRMDFLFVHPLCQDLSLEALVELCSQAVEVTYHKGDVVFYQDDPNYDIFIIQEGELALEKLQVSLKNGDIFGEMAFFTKDKRTATIVAVEETKCLVLKSANLDTMAQSHPGIYQQIGRTIVSRVNS